MFYPENTELYRIIEKLTNFFVQNFIHLYDLRQQGI
jgi:hypothetical protein